MVDKANFKFVQLYHLKTVLAKLGVVLAKKDLHHLLKSNQKSKTPQNEELR